MSRRLLLFTLILLIIISSNLLMNNQKVQSKEKEIKYKENSALALNYHRIRNDNFFDDFLSIFSNSKELSTYSITKEEFEKQIKWLKEHHAHFLTEEEFIKYKKIGKFPKRSVWINFDDMDQSIYKNAHPVLEKYNIPATGFVITGNVGAENFNNINLITLKELKKMKKSGLWTFSSHTNNLHKLSKNKSMMVKTSNKNFVDDISKSNEYLKKHFNYDNESLAYPYGQIDQEKEKNLKKAGIKYGYVLEERPVEPGDDNYYIPRILVSDDAFHQIIQKWDGFKNE